MEQVGGRQSPAVPAREGTGAKEWTIAERVIVQVPVHVGHPQAKEARVAGG